MSHNAGSPKQASRCLRKVLRHIFSNSAKGSVRHSLFGKTRKPYPGSNAGRTERPNSRKRRLALLRRTAIPNRRPITIPSMAWGNISGQTWRLNNPVETRRPAFLICSISRLRFRKNGIGPCPCAINNSPACPQDSPALTSPPACWSYRPCGVISPTTLKTI